MVSDASGYFPEDADGNSEFVAAFSELAFLPSGDGGGMAEGGGGQFKRGIC